MIQIESIEEPFSNPEISGRTLGVLKRVDAMGLMKESPGRSLSISAFRKVIQSLQRAGIALSQSDLSLDAQALRNDDNKRRFRAALDKLTEVLEDSPVPKYEWAPLVKLFRPDLQLLARILATSLSSLRRYQANERETPDEVAERLHFIALTTSDLVGAYNDLGVRRWFQRKRTLLDGHAPIDLLRPGWTPDDPGPTRVRNLARSLASSPAT
ncbi:MAG: hypothetical protein HYZ28_01385 [Myxococcales bacterium]|nr:hypothetical protein [Myxococcales bacterium]